MQALGGLGPRGLRKLTLPEHRGRAGKVALSAGSSQLSFWRSPPLLAEPQTNCQPKGSPVQGWSFPKPPRPGDRGREGSRPGLHPNSLPDPTVDRGAAPPEGTLGPQGPGSST